MFQVYVSNWKCHPLDLLDLKGKIYIFVFVFGVKVFLIEFG